MFENQIYTRMFQVMNEFSKFYTDPLEKEAATYELNIWDLYTGILPAKMFDPDPISIERIRKRNPYNAPVYYTATMEKLHKAGTFESVPEGGYILTQQGHILFRRCMSVLYQHLELCSPLPPTDVEELKLLLAKLVQATLLSGTPPCKWNITHNRRLDPGVNVTAIVKIDQYLTDLIAYRDDAHLATWQHYQVSGHAWDVLYRIWNGNASNFNELRSLVESRAWTTQETDSAIDELLKKKWIEQNEPFALTNLGKKIRDESEALTNEYFFTPWQVLSKTEKTTLDKLLSQLLEKLEEK